ncbi:MAG TPA: DUF86 domain-containing protein [Candidatus Cloacimonetes bacterium]|nr:DUF86 domain-containing protein [Candidatus Cloacimonadota bacterium]
MPNENIILRLIANIESYLEDLKKVREISFQEFTDDIIKQRFIERTLHIIIESVLDITHHIISDLKLREPNSYADAFNVLFENKIITEKTGDNGKLMAQFRNRLVHYYEKNEPEIIFEILKKHQIDFMIFINEMKEFINFGVK